MISAIELKDLEQTFDVQDQQVDATWIEANMLGPSTQVRIGQRIRFFGKKNDPAWFWDKASAEDQAQDLWIEVFNALKSKGIYTTLVRREGKSSPDGNRVILVEVEIQQVYDPYTFESKPIITVGTLAGSGTGSAVRSAASFITSKFTWIVAALIAWKIDSTASTVEDSLKSPNILPFLDTIKVLGVVAVVIALVYAYSKSQT